MAAILRLVERSQSSDRPGGRQLYLTAVPAATERILEGVLRVSSLIDLKDRSTPEEVVRMIRKGGGRMPGFHELDEEELQAVICYLLRGEDTPLSRDDRETGKPLLRYRHDGYKKFLDSEGYPAVRPPGGTLTAISLDQGEIVWQIPLGEFPELAERVW